MGKKPRCLQIDICGFEKEGLYLIFPDSTWLDLTRDNIENEAKKFWEDPAKITPQLKEAIEFKKCSYCPRKARNDICDAIRPVLPFLDRIDKYVSFDKVTAIYKGKEGLIHVKDTSMQEALRYVSILSLIYYHQTNRKYWRYFYGIIPIAGVRDTAARMYLNMYWVHKGDKEKIKKIIEQFIEELRESSDNQVKRLNLICKNDAFMNAFVSAQVVTEFLSMDINKTLDQSIHDFGKEAAELGYIPAFALKNRGRLTLS